jgi:hypothetical protein
MGFVSGHRSEPGNSAGSITNATRAAPQTMGSGYNPKGTASLIAITEMESKRSKTKTKYRPRNQGRSNTPAIVRWILSFVHECLTRSVGAALSVVQMY